MTLFIIFLCSFFAFAISAICGGGAGLLLIPVLGNFLPISQVPAALSIGTFSSSASRVAVFKDKICWSIVRYFVPAALPAVWLGAWMLKFVNPVYLEFAMGLFLISNVAFVFKKPSELTDESKPKNLILVLIGFSAGFISGLTGAVGLLFNKFYLRYGLTKEEIVATRAANEIVLHLVKIILYTFLGLISTKVITVGIVVAVSAILSTWTMKWVLPRLSEVLFKKIGYIAMVISGCMMFGESGSHIARSNGGHLTTYAYEEGLETKLKWQDSAFAFEFTEDDGFEFEQVIPIDELSKEQRQLIFSKKNQADKIIVEVVHSLHSTSYEAYYFKNNAYANKIEFN